MLSFQQEALLAFTFQLPVEQQWWEEVQQPLVVAMPVQGADVHSTLQGLLTSDMAPSMRLGFVCTFIYINNMEQTVPIRRLCSGRNLTAGWWKISDL